MTLLADETAISIAENFAELPTTVTFRRVTTGSGPNPTRTTTDYLVDGLIGGYSADMMANGVVKIADLRVTLQPVAQDGTAFPQPTITDLLLIGGTQRTIISVKPVYAGGDIAVYDIQAR